MFASCTRVLEGYVYSLLEGEDLTCEWFCSVSWSPSTERTSLGREAARTERTHKLTFMFFVWVRRFAYTEVFPGKWTIKLVFICIPISLTVPLLPWWRYVSQAYQNCLLLNQEFLEQVNIYFWRDSVSLNCNALEISYICSAVNCETPGSWVVYPSQNSVIL